MYDRGIRNPSLDLIYSSSAFTVVLCSAVHFKSALSPNNIELHVAFRAKFAVYSLKYDKATYKDCISNTEVGTFHSAITF